jgi:hypothetical protein
MSSTREPTLERMLRLVLEHAAAELRVAIPGRVEEVYEDGTRVDVKPLIKHAMVTTADVAVVGDEREEVSLPVLPKLVVEWPRAGGFFSGARPVVGDTGRIVIYDNSLSEFLESDGEEVAPRLLNRHHLSNATFVPGLSVLNRAIADIPEGSIVVGSVDPSKLRVLVKEAVVEIVEGGDATVFAAIFDNLKAAYDAHTHSSPAGGATGVPVVLLPANVKASKLKFQV